ncbi:MAG: hypothetical protein H6569_11500 [Lewinellaceae bacterium]|nr:hypothetical protein [Lewinellaceae bacterium]
MRKSVLLLVLLLFGTVKLVAQKIEYQLQRVDQCIQRGELGLAILVLDSAYNSPLAKYKIDSINLRKQVIFEELDVPESSIAVPESIQNPDKMPNSDGAIISFSPSIGQTIFSLEELRNMKARELASILKISVQKYEASQYVLKRIRLLDFVYSSDSWFIPTADGETYRIDDAFATDLKRFQDLIKDKNVDALNMEAWSKVEAFYARLDAAFLKTLPLLPREFPKPSIDMIRLQRDKLLPKTIGDKPISMWELHGKLDKIFQDLKFEPKYQQYENGFLAILELTKKQVDREIEYFSSNYFAGTFFDMYKHSGEIVIYFGKDCDIEIVPNSHLNTSSASTGSLSYESEAKSFEFNSICCQILVYFKSTSRYEPAEGNHIQEHRDGKGFMERICLKNKLMDKPCTN